MPTADTVKLLKECNSGIKMGVSAIEEILPSVKDEEFKNLLEKSLNENRKLGDETRQMLNDAGDDGKEPHLMARGMAWFKTNAMLAMEASDKTAADLLTDGCDMGIKSINRYLNQYQNAEEYAKDIAIKIIDMQERLEKNVRKFL